MGPAVKEVLPSPVDALLALGVPALPRRWLRLGAQMAPLVLPPGAPSTVGVAALSQSP